jgi:hypothetical protein
MSVKIQRNISTTESTALIDDSYLDDLRDMVLKSEQEELASTERTQLLDRGSNNIIGKRSRLKKINPKFCTEWVNLELDMQINRIIEYVTRFSAENDLPNSTAKKIRKLLVEALVKESLTEIEWDITTGTIVKIPKLFFNPYDGYFLGTYLNKEGELATRISKISNIEDGMITTEEFNQNKRTLNIIKK